MVKKRKKTIKGWWWKQFWCFLRNWCIHNDIYRTVQKAIFKGEKANYTAGLIECWISILHFWWCNSECLQCHGLWLHLSQWSWWSCQNQWNYESRNVQIPFGKHLIGNRFILQYENDPKHTRFKRFFFLNFNWNTISDGLVSSHPEPQHYWSIVGSSWQRTK